MASLAGELPAETVTSTMRTEGDTGRYNTRGRSRGSKETARSWTFAQDWQRDILRRSFEENAYPDRKELDRIGAEVGLEVKWLKNWYHSQRKKKNARKETTKTEDIKQEAEEDGGEADVEDDHDVTGDGDVGDSLESACVGGDEKARLLEDLQRRFTELEARYTLMAGLLLERGLVTAGEAEQLPGDTLAETAGAGDQEAATTQPQTAAAQAAVPVKEEKEVKQEAAAVYPGPLPAQYPAYPYPQFYPAPPGYLPYHPQYFPLAQSQPQQPPQAGPLQPSPQPPLGAPPGYPQGYPQPPAAGQPQYQPHYPPLLHHYPPPQFAAQPQPAPQPS